LLVGERMDAEKMACGWGCDGVLNYYWLSVGRRSE
jgi:hypothetical protein